jgi:hypothetical protein
MALAAPVSCTYSYTGTTLTDPALALPLRANGTDLESLYRQMLSQFQHPLTADNKVSAACAVLYVFVIAHASHDTDCGKLVTNKGTVSRLIVWGNMLL